jgi:hypothetical protein
MAVYRGLVQTLVASAARTTSGNSGVLNLGGPGGVPDAGTFILNVTASSVPTTLDVYLQHSPDAGVTFYDFGHFAQVLAVSTNIQALIWSRRSTDGTQGVNVIANGDAALAPSKVIAAPIRDAQFRVKWVIVGTSYTFQVLAILDRD